MTTYRWAMTTVLMALAVVTFVGAFAISIYAAWQPNWGTYNSPWTTTLWFVWVFAIITVPAELFTSWLVCPGTDQ